MKRVIAVITLLLLLLLLLPIVALAEDAPPPVDATPTPTPKPEVIVVYINVIPTPEPAQPPKRDVFYNEYTWDADTVDAVASVYWAECNTDAEKLAVTQLLANRAAHGAPFRDTIADCAMQKGEFNRGRISDRNRDKAVVNLNKVMTQSLGLYAGITVPETALYMSRVDGDLVMLDADFYEVWRAK